VYRRKRSPLLPLLLLLLLLLPPLLPPPAEHRGADRWTEAGQGVGMDRPR